MSEPTQEQPSVDTPTVTTAPAGSRWSRIPDHLGRARTSTVVLAVLFVAFFTLYLYVKPDAPESAATGTSNPAPVSTPARAPETSATPSTEAPGTTQEEPTPTQQPTTSAVPTDTTAPGTATSSTPTPTSTPTGPSTSVAPVPTTAVPTG